MTQTIPLKAPNMYFPSTSNKKRGWLHYTVSAVLGLWWLFILLGLIGVAAEGLSIEDESSTDSGASTLIAVAESDYRANNALTRGAPQQQVANGWFVRDTLPILSTQLDTVSQQVTTVANQNLKMQQAMFSLAFTIFIGIAGDFLVRRATGRWR